MRHASRHLLTIVTAMVFLLWGLCCKTEGQQAMTAYWPLTNLVGLAAATNVTDFQVTSLCPDAANTNFLPFNLTLDINRANTPSLATNPVPTATLTAGYGYVIRVMAYGLWQPVYFTNDFPTNLAGTTVNGAGWQAVNLTYPCPFTPAYLSAMVSNITYVFNVPGITNYFYTNAPNTPVTGGEIPIYTNFDALGAASNAQAYAQAASNSVATQNAGVLTSVTNNYAASTNFTITYADTNNAAAYFAGLVTNLVVSTASAGTNNLNTASNVLAGQYSVLTNQVVTTNAIWLASKQPASLNLTNWSLLSTSSMASLVILTNYADTNNAAAYFAGLVTNLVVSTATTGTNNLNTASNMLAGQYSVLTNQVTTTNAIWLASKQPASLNLTNWSLLSTSGIPSLLTLTNYADTNGAAAYWGGLVTNFVVSTASTGTNNLNTASNVLAGQYSVLTNQVVTTNTIIFNTKQPASLNLTNWSLLSTSAIPSLLTLTNYADTNGAAAYWAGLVSNFVVSTASTGTNNLNTASNVLGSEYAVLTNQVVTTNTIVFNTKQPSSGNLTNWSLLSTSGMASLVILTNYADTNNAAAYFAGLVTNFVVSTATTGTNNLNTASNVLAGQYSVLTNQVTTTNAIWLVSKQPAGANLTNWNSLATNAFPNTNFIYANFETNGTTAAQTNNLWGWALAYFTPLGWAVTNNEAGQDVTFGGFVLGTTGGGGPYTRTLSAQAGDNARITIAQTTGETFYDSAGNLQGTINPLGLTVSNETVINNLFATATNANTFAGQPTNDFATTNLTWSLFNSSTNFATTNTAAAVASATNALGFAFVASTNGTGTWMTHAAGFYWGMAGTSFTNILGSTNLIGLFGPGNNGTYETASGGLTWTNWQNASEFMSLITNTYFLQTNNGSAVVTLYSWPTMLGLGTPVNGPAPAPVAGYGGYWRVPEFKFVGTPDWPELWSAVTNAVANGVTNDVQPGFGLLGYLLGTTNTLGVNSNVVATVAYVQAEIAGIGGNTNGTTPTQVSNIVSSYGGTLFWPLADTTVLTNLVLTNAGASYLIADAYVLNTNASSGGGITLGQATSVVNNAQSGGVVSGAVTNEVFSNVGTNAIQGIAAGYISASGNYIASTNGTGWGTTLVQGSNLQTTNLNVNGVGLFDNTNLQIILNATQPAVSTNGNLDGTFSAGAQFSASGSFSYGVQFVAANNLQVIELGFSNSASADEGLAENLTLATNTGAAVASANITIGNSVGWQYFSVTPGAIYAGGTYVLWRTNNSNGGHFYEDGIGTFNPVASESSPVYFSNGSLFGSGSGDLVDFIYTNGPAYANVNALNSALGVQINATNNGVGINTPAPPSGLSVGKGDIVSAGNLQGGSIIATQLVLNGNLILPSAAQQAFITELNISGFVTNGIPSSYWGWTNIDGNYFRGTNTQFFNTPDWTNANSLGVIRQSGQTGNSVGWIIGTNLNGGTVTLYGKNGIYDWSGAVGTYTLANSAVLAGVTPQLLPVSIAAWSTNFSSPVIVISSSLNVTASTNNSVVTYDVESPNTNSAIVTLLNGTNIVSASWFNTNHAPTLTYYSLDGTVASLFMKESEWSQTNYFTIRSANSADTNQVGYKQ